MSQTSDFKSDNILHPLYILLTRIRVRFEIGRLRRRISRDWTSQTSDCERLDMWNVRMWNDMWNVRSREIPRLRRPILEVITTPKKTVKKHSNFGTMQIRQKRHPMHLRSPVARQRLFRMAIDYSVCLSTWSYTKDMLNTYHHNDLYNS